MLTSSAINKWKKISISSTTFCSLKMYVCNCKLYFPHWLQVQQVAWSMIISNTDVYFGTALKKIFLAYWINAMFCYICIHSRVKHLHKHSTMTKVWMNCVQLSRERRMLSHMEAYIMPHYLVITHSPERNDDSVCWGSLASSRWCWPALAVHTDHLTSTLCHTQV